MFKTVSTDCNLDCRYCYYRKSLEGTRGRHRLDDALLERFIPEYLNYVADAGQASFGWQGGEPTLAGLPFFERVVALQQAYARTGTVIQNALQTNAVLLDDDWGRFFSRHRWLIGVSLDGPREIHDALRTDKAGRGSFDRVRRGVEVLQRHKVDFNILCVLGPHNVEKPRELIEFYRRQGFSHVQFIPAMDFQASEPRQPAAYQITPELYGDFLIQAFDCWYQDGFPTLSVRLFDNFLQNYLGMPNDLCTHSGVCDSGIVIEYDGSAYPCDFYIHPDWLLGNVLETPLREIAGSAAKQAFRAQKDPPPPDCIKCPWLKVCRSGCPRNRGWAPEGLMPDYFCASYKRFFSNEEEKLNRLKTTIQNKWKYLRLTNSAPHLLAKAGRNDPCPCGSAKKHKQCCGNPAQASSYLFNAS